MSSEANSKRAREIQSSDDEDSPARVKAVRSKPSLHKQDDGGDLSESTFASRGAKPIGANTDEKGTESNSSLPCDADIFQFQLKKLTDANSDSNATIVSGTLMSIGELTRHDANGSRNETALKSGCPHAIVWSMRKWKNDKHIQSAACFCIASLCNAACPAVAESLVHSGAIDAISEAMQTFDGDANLDLQKVACSALRSLLETANAVHNKYISHFVYKYHGIQHMVKGIKAQNDPHRKDALFIVNWLTQYSTEYRQAIFGQGIQRCLADFIVNAMLDTDVIQDRCAQDKNILKYQEMMKCVASILSKVYSMDAQD